MWEEGAYLGVSEDEVLSGESRRRAPASFAAASPLEMPFCLPVRARRPASCAASLRAGQSAEVAIVVIFWSMRVCIVGCRNCSEQASVFEKGERD